MSEVQYSPLARAVSDVDVTMGQAASFRIRSLAESRSYNQLAARWNVEDRERAGKVEDREPCLTSVHWIVHASSSPSQHLAFGGMVRTAITEPAREPISGREPLPRQKRNSVCGEGYEEQAKMVCPSQL